jgi:subtilisin-like proprotein convertase family protein
VEYYLTAAGTNGFTTSLPYRAPDTAFSFTTGPWRRIAYAEAPATPIPDGVGWGVTSTINVPVAESGSILVVTVDIGIIHPDRGELEVLLTGPDGTTITLHDNSGSGQAHLSGNWPGSLTVDGPGSLDDFRERSNKGEWTLQVIDNVPGGSGTLDSWGLHFTLVRYVTPVHDTPVPVLTTLGPNVPNPFNPRTEISFHLAHSGQTQLSIFDVRGMLVRRLLDENLPAGPHGVVWDGLDRTGRAVSSGTYFYRLESGSEVLARKMLLIR